MSNIKFNSNGNTTVKLLKVENPYQITITANNSSYQIGQEIALSNNDSVEFEIASGSFSKDDMNYYQFVITGTGTVSLSGSLSEVTNAYQYYNLFKDCDKITDASNLTFTGTTAKKFCFSNMFANCTALTTPPSTLPATTLADWCYQGMFAGCINLTGAPALPASALVDYCYYAMFYGCEKLKDSPTLNAQSLEDWCYNSMFYKCKSLSSITCELTGFTPANATSSWVFGIADEGEFINSNTIEQYGTSKIPSGWTEIQPEPPSPPTPPTIEALTFTGKSDTNAVQLSAVGSPSAITLNYSKNNGTWTAYTIGDIIELNQNETVAFSGNNDHFSNSSSDFYKFQMTGTIEGAGNIQSLMNYGDSLTDYCYRGMFSGCTSLTQAPSLPATGLANWCYSNMFWNCYSLTAAPELPATELAVGCYNYMFYYCTNLSTAPELPATTLSQSCYSLMFAWCSSLSTAPELQATTLANWCYQGMFEYCTSLSTAPALPATDLANGCYWEMFRGCSNLSNIEVGFTDWGGNLNATYNWVNGVANNGVFTKPNELSTEYDVHRIPSGWTVVDK